MPVFNFQMCDACKSYSNTSLCDGDCEKNIWFVNGKCKLDELTFDQVYFILQRNPSAKKDLLRVTTNQELIQLATYSQLIKDPIEDDMRPYRLVNNPAQTLPFYTLFKGNLNRNFND